MEYVVKLAVLYDMLRSLSRSGFYDFFIDILLNNALVNISIETSSVSIKQSETYNLDKIERIEIIDRKTWSKLLVIKNIDMYPGGIGVDYIKQIFDNSMFFFKYGEKVFNTDIKEVMITNYVIDLPSNKYMFSIDIVSLYNEHAILEIIDNELECRHYDENDHEIYKKKNCLPYNLVMERIDKISQIIYKILLSTLYLIL